MAQTTRSTPRTGARFGRSTPAPSAGRFARSAGSQPRPRRTPTRSGTRTPSPFARPSGRRSKQQKGIAGALTGLLPTGAASKATPSSKTGKAGGIAALAAAAGVAFRNREKLSAMVNRKRDGEQGFDTTPATPTATPAVTPTNGPDRPTPPAPGI